MGVGNYVENLRMFLLLQDALCVMKSIFPLEALSV